MKGEINLMKSMFYKGENISPWGLIFSLLNRKIRKIDYAEFQNLSQEEKDGGTLWCVINAPDIDVLRYYPVGCYFETTDTTFNPNTEWGGTWELESGGLVHVSAGTNYVVSANVKDGGEATHLLTAAESGVPAHAHPASSGTGTTTGMRIVGSYGTTHAANHIPGYNGGSYTDITGGSFSGANHTHSITVSNNTALNATTAHNNMQPYKIVNRWHRTA